MEQDRARGAWPRPSVGLFDRTHLRWFTLRDAHDLLDQAGLEMERVSRRLLCLAPPLRGPEPVLHLLARLPGRTLLTYQHVLLARRRE